MRVAPYRFREDHTHSAEVWNVNRAPLDTICWQEPLG